MAGKIITVVMDMADKFAVRQNVDVIDAEYKKEGKDWFLRIFIDKPGGVGIDDCEKFSRAFEEMLDKEDVVQNSYCLEVSSPGADRKLVKEREFRYYIGRKVDVKLYKASDGVKEFSGILEGFENKTAKISTDKGTVEIPQSDAVWIRLSFEF
ncbi:MAG: ribosome maturation factor RimP [Oscillospiraceae bacterium]|nr:ribosome maturation factor RimP [Oscillospiraceae bacterium]